MKTAPLPQTRTPSIDSHHYACRLLQHTKTHEHTRELPDLATSVANDRT
jgi:hypothetical protein